MKVLIYTHQHCLGDIICSEPTVMGICLANRGAEFTLVTPAPEVFRNYPIPLRIENDYFSLRGVTFDKTYMAYTDGCRDLVHAPADDLGIQLPYTRPVNYGNFSYAHERPYLIVSNDANSLERRLPRHEFIDLVRIVESHGFDVVITGRSISDANILCCKNLAGGTSREQLFNVAKCASGGIVADSGLSHILASFNIPYVAWSDISEGLRSHGDITYWVPSNSGTYSPEVLRSQTEQLIRRICKV